MAEAWTQRASPGFLVPFSHEVVTIVQRWKDANSCQAFEEQHRSSMHIRVGCREG